MALDEIHRIGILGGGVMGGGITQVHALAGQSILVCDISDDAIARTRHEVVDGSWGIKRGVERGKCKFDDAVAAIARIAFTTSRDELASCDILIEAIPEDLALKQRIWSELDARMPARMIFASNTSGFCIQDVARDVSAERKSRFLGMHYSNPVPAMRMCEIIVTPQTAAETVATCAALAESAGRVVSMVKDTPGTYGFLLNRIFGAARREADAIVAAGIATPEDIDRAMISGRNWPAGFYGNRGGLGKQW